MLIRRKEWDEFKPSYDAFKFLIPWLLFGVLCEFIGPLQHYRNQLDSFSCTYSIFWIYCVNSQIDIIFHIHTMHRNREPFSEQEYWSHRCFWKTTNCSFRLCFFFFFLITATALSSPHPLVRLFLGLSKHSYLFFFSSRALLSYSFIHSDPSSLAGCEELSWGGAEAIFSNEPLPCQRRGNFASSSWMLGVVLHLDNARVCAFVCNCVIIKPCARWL